MAHANPPDETLRHLLSEASTIAVVGASSDPSRPSNGVFSRLQQAGYRVIPINPNETEVHGERAFASLTDVPVKVDIVDVFRRADATLPIAADAVTIGARALWLQQGVWNEEAAARASGAGLVVVMDRCIAVELAVLGVKPRPDTQS